MRSFPITIRFCANAHFRQPAEEPEDLASLRVEEEPEIAGADVFGVLAGEGLKTPAEIFAAPRTEAMAARGVPEESDGRSHRWVPDSIIGGRPRRNDAALFDDRLEERRGKQACELAIRRGVIDEQRAGVGVDAGLVQRLLFQG